ncbi:MAG: hypothetical protein H6733_17030 [Alphaproteobacteria bacterium]|nr:hypothetical protein [Alphaproteobacteria bacterium]
MRRGGIARSVGVVLAWGCLLGCTRATDTDADDTDTDTDTPVETDSDTTVDTDDTTGPVLPDYQPLDAIDLLVRASLDLRGIRPSIDDLGRVEADPAVVETLIAAYLEDDRVGRRVREMWDEVFLVRDEETFVTLDYFRQRHSLAELARSIGEEPTRMLERIVVEDRPYTEFVTADWTVVNDVLADMWPVDYPAGAQGWQTAHYTDGRPAAGVLSTNGLWWQAGSMLNNLNRGRANEVSRTLLCFDYLNTEIDFTGVGALDSEAALGNAIRTDPACTACHNTLDPLASHFFGFFYYDAQKRDPLDVRVYHPERERLWQTLGGLPPAFHRVPTQGLADLGRTIAADPDYSHCFAKRAWEGLLHRDVLPAERTLIDGHDAAFRAGSLRVRAVLRDIVASDAYRNGGPEYGRKLASPTILSSEVEDLTGFSWTTDDWDLVRAPVTGFGPLVGGVDGIYRSVRLDEPSTTMVLVQKRLAEAAASWVTTHDIVERVETPKLLRIADGSEDPDTATGEQRIRNQIAALHARIVSERVDPAGATVDEELSLFRDVLDQTGRPHEAWAAIVTLLLRDPRLVVF